MAPCNIGFLGGGNMAQAIFSGLRKYQKSKSVAVFDPAIVEDSLWHKEEAKICSSFEELYESCDWMIWAVKPQIFSEQFEKKTLPSFKGEGWVSVMAGVTIDRLENLSSEIPIVRTMPNTPVMVGQGMVALAGNSKTKGDMLSEVESFFQGSAQTLIVEESALDGVTAISGSGPAYLFYLSEAVLNQAHHLGLKPQQALDLWSQTLKGSAEMLQQSKESPEILRKKVTSPGGTTEAALNTFADSQMSQIFEKGLEAAHRRSIELSGH